MKYIARAPFSFRDLLVQSLLFVILVPPGITAAQKFTQSKDDLGKIIQDKAQSVLATCQSWPPKLAKKPEDQNKAPGSKALQDGTDLITMQLTRATFALDPAIKPFQYDASFLRLLDSVDTGDPAISDDKLFGLAQVADANQLNLWGTNLAIVKYDCMSVLSLLVQSNASLSIPFFSLNAAFRANNERLADQTSTFMIGLFQSPFNSLYYAQDQPRRIFAGMKAIDWRIRSHNRGQAQYISTAHFLSVTKNTASSETLGIMGNFKAGVQIPFLQLGGTTAGQISHSLQIDSRGYLTYFWDPAQENLPELPSLSAHVSDNLPALVAETDTMTPGTEVAAKQSVRGWPSSLCVASNWIPRAENKRFTMGSLKMAPEPESGGLPTCNITLFFSLAAGGGGDVRDPQLVLSHAEDGVGDPQIVIPFHLSNALHLKVKSNDPVRQREIFTPEGIYLWQVSATNVRWRGKIEVDQNGRVVAIELKTIEFCQGEFRALNLLDSFDLNLARFKIDPAGQLTIDIPVKWNRYDAQCNKIRVEPERLTGKLNQTRAYNGDVRYEVSPGIGEYGGMILVRQ